MKRGDLTTKQREAIELLVDSKLRTILVLGGPGSGKTTTALWAARTFLEAQKPTRWALFLTFSRAAVSQIASRCRAVLSGMEGRIEIVTFHGLAFRILNAFGRYAGLGTTPVSIQSETRLKLFEREPGQFVYRELIPSAMELLVGSERIGTLLANRWPVIIVDEVQDTNQEHWDFAQRLAPEKLLLLGDPGQMIYADFVDGVGPEHFAWLERQADKIVRLEDRSHRDPTGVIPALASAVRRRAFQDDAVAAALASGRLIVETQVPLEEVPPLVARCVREERANGARSVSVFAHSNAAVAELADSLQELGIEHDLIGIPEAHGEALSTIRELMRFSAGYASEEDIRAAFAMFLTAIVRGRTPELALAFLRRDGNELPPTIEEELRSLLADMGALRGQPVQQLFPLVAEAWPRLRIAGGQRPWNRAARHFVRMARGFSHRSIAEDSISELDAVVENNVTAALIDLERPEPNATSLMNYHQTKGREADVIIHVYRSDDFFGPEVEPFRKGSRLLNVALSRARQKVIVILPENPHPLVEPFADL